MLHKQLRIRIPTSSCTNYTWRLVPSSVQRIQLGARKRRTLMCHASIEASSQAVTRRRLAQLSLSGAILLGGSNRAGASEEETQVLPRSDNDDVSAETEGAPTGSNKISRGRGGPPLPLVPKAALRKVDKQSPPLEVSRVVKGCWQLDGEHKGNPKTDRTSGSAAMTDFERFNAAGITTVDTADIYGPSESQIGQYLRLYPWRRDQMQICTKVTIMEEDVPQLTQDLLEYRIRRSMARLGVSSLDLVQLHWENFEQQKSEVRSPRGSRKVAGSVDAAKWMADLQGRGLIKGLGLTNFDVPHLLQIVDAGVEVASHQVQYSVLDRRPELYMMDLCEKRGIPIIAYGTLVR
ncbi:NADP-dependent oxidoreductase domain-containing protein [Dunaliella salina]|uniref:NADP-dependent oxidoreductase domain-containing protein n=1 Tax=Dunaliella salina TaxID=3046 RepID=A0ABQ7H2A2_DUNSA|nr:NADP-dependent oxidoreductase domain-containing protein [Dunaliella salina]|eukprot:KAF5840986.1 NADP-dependent oxidoreductase domain-containing protein [Dunaliella salina]